MVIEPIFENGFAEHSYGFRPGRGCKDALRRVDELLKAERLHVVEVDIKGYFDAIPHDRLMALVRELAAQGAQGVILGCTELTMILQPGDGGLPSFDTTELHAMAAVDFSLS